LFLARECIVNVVELFEVDEAVDVVAFREAFDFAGLVFGSSAIQRVSDADVECRASLVAEDVDVVAAGHACATVLGSEGRAQ
jgi:hypothetical protein